MCVKNEGFVFKMMNFADGDAVWWRVRHFKYKFTIYNAKCITFNAKLIILNKKIQVHLHELPEVWQGVRKHFVLQMTNLFI